MELLALPGVVRVVVALGALDLHAEEDPRDLAGQLDRPGPSWAAAKAAAPFSSFRPVAVMIAVAISSQGAFAANCSASQSSSAW